MTFYGGGGGEGGGRSSRAHHHFDYRYSIFHLVTTVVDNLPKFLHVVKYK
jgi:hypothetical protein